MMDSGAFSSWTQKKPIVIKEYADFLLSNKDHITYPINLDSINPGDPEVAAAKGWDNFCYLRDRGITSLPVFHARESTKWLDKMLNESSYIGLSGTSLVSPSEHTKWYDLMFQIVTDRLGRPIADFHAFGDTAAPSLLRFPWRSCDSSSWQIQSGKTGTIVINGTPFKLRSKTRGDAKYLADDDPAEKKIIWQNYIREKGLDPDLIMSTELKAVELTMVRCYLNASYFLDLQEKTRSTTTYKQGIGLQSLKRDVMGKERDGPVNLYFVVSTAVCGWALPVLARLGIKNLLLSYYYCEKKFWEREFVPYLYDPVGECQRNPRFKRFADLLDKFTLKKATSA